MSIACSLDLDNKRTVNAHVLCSGFIGSTMRDLCTSDTVSFIYVLGSKNQTICLCQLSTKRQKWEMTTDDAIDVLNVHKLDLTNAFIMKK